MDLDAAQTAAAVMPYVTAAATAYGVNTLDKVRDTIIDKASNETVSVGHKILNRLLRRPESREPIEELIVELSHEEDDSSAALRYQIRKALSADPDLANDIASILASETTQSTATGDSSTAIGKQENSGNGTFVGRDNFGQINRPESV